MCNAKRSDVSKLITARNQRKSKVEINLYAGRRSQVCYRREIPSTDAGDSQPDIPAQQICIRKHIRTVFTAAIERQCDKHVPDKNNALSRLQCRC